MIGLLSSLIRKFNRVWETHLLQFNNPITVWRILSISTKTTTIVIDLVISQKLGVFRTPFYRDNTDIDYQAEIEASSRHRKFKRGCNALKLHEYWRCDHLLTNSVCHMWFASCQSLGTTQSSKYLGVHLTLNLRSNKHVGTTRNEASTTLVTST